MPTQGITPSYVYLWVDFTLGCISLVSSSFVIFTFAAWKQGRKAPGDIILALAISSLLLSIYWIVFPIYYLSTNEPPNANGKFCQGFGFISSIGFFGQFVYNFAYCLTLRQFITYSRQAITNVLKVNTKFKLLAQAICLGLTLTAPLYLLLSDQIGLDQFGMCAILLEQQSIFIEILLQFVYIISALYTIWYFYQNIPDESSLKQYKSKLLFRYVFYIGSTVIMLVFMAVSNIASALVKDSSSTEADGLYYALIANIAFTMGPVILSIVRLKNPAINEKLKKLISRAFLVDQKLEIEIPIAKLNSSEAADPQFSDLQKHIRMFQIKTILNGIVYYYTHKYEKFEERIHAVQRTSSRTVSESMTQKLLDLKDQSDVDIAETLAYYKLDNKALNQEYSFHIHTKAGEALEEKMAQKNLQLYPRMCALAPRFFSLLYYFDQIEINAADSFDLEQNAANIESMIGPDGGKSGEFFFFTYDCKWILKTITDDELLAFRMRFPQYIHHMHRNRDSLINKMYGIFSIDMNQMQTQLSKDNSVYHMVLMRNLSQVPRQYISRIFDLKGSEVAREVLKGKSGQYDLSKLTLKDKDFENTEIRVKIHDCSEIKQQLISDARFFQKAQLMDYSLLIMKVDWRRYIEDTHTSFENVKKNFSKLMLIPVEDDPSSYYHFSVIDYFQEWNLKKVTEKAAKQFIALDTKLDTSAQNPDIYAERFIANVVEKFFKS